MWNRIVDVMTGRTRLRPWQGPYRIEVLIDQSRLRRPHPLHPAIEGVPAPVHLHEGEAFVAGRPGARYAVRVVNESGRRVEAVVSVDGRDVIDGEAADWGKGGYLVPAWGAVDIEGWRVSSGRVAAFRFAPVGASYAARRGAGRDVGVIGAAIFPEQAQVVRRCAVPAPCATGWEAAQAPCGRPGLGTAFGEPVRAPVREVAFCRAGTRPAALIGVRYDDAAGLRRAGVALDEGRFWDEWDEVRARRTADPFPGRRYARPPWDWEG